MDSSRSRTLNRIIRLLSFIVCALCALLVSIDSLYYAGHVDWTLLGVAVLCLAPLLLLLDLFSLCVLIRVARVRRASAEGLSKQDEKDMRERAVSLGTLALLHVGTAGLAVFLLAVPASSVWMNGLTMPRLRALLVALATLGFLLALPLPYSCVCNLLTLFRLPETGEGSGDTRERENGKDAARGSAATDALKDTAKDSAKGAAAPETDMTGTGATKDGEFSFSPADGKDRERA